MARIKLSMLKKRPKYGNKKVICEGWKFDSKLEADFYLHLKFLKEAGKVKFFSRQFPLHLAPGSKLVVDFLVQYEDDPKLYFLDTKGFITANARTKIKMAEHRYGIEIGIVKRGDF